MPKTPWGPEHPKYPNCPVAPGTDCTVYFRDGGHWQFDQPESWRWAHGDNRGDIIAYTDHSAPDQARELLASIRDDAAKAARIVRENLYRQSEKVEDAPRILDALAARIDAYLKGAS